MSPWLLEIRILTISAVGFCLGLLLVLVPKFLRLAIRREDRIHLLDVEWMVVAAIGEAFLVLGAMLETFDRWHETSFTWRSIVYLVGFVLIDIVLIRAAQLARDWGKK